MLKISKKDHIHKMSSENEPCVSISPNTRIIVETWDALKGRAKEYYDNRTPYPEIFPQANPATGPIYVEDANPGDTLEIYIHDIKLDRCGYITKQKNKVNSRESLSEPDHLEIHVLGDKLICGGNGRLLPAEPMIGVIGTAPKPGMDMWCQEAGDHGSNMDARIIRKGATLLLPVFVEGALLALGDVHAAMGDGEVFGQGVEIGAEVEISVTVRKDLAIQRPIVLLDDRIACIASHQDIEVAKDIAIQDMGEYLAAIYQLNADDVFSLIAFYGNLHFCQIVNPQKTLRMEIESKYIECFTNQR